MFWYDLFPTVLDMTLTGSIVIGVVLLLRLALKKAPRIFSYALWAVVLFRLLCPVTPEAPVGVLRETEMVQGQYTLAERPVTVMEAAEAAYRATGDAVNGGLGVQRIETGETIATSSWWEVWVLFGQYVWLAGVGVMLLWSAIQYIKLRRGLVGAVRRRDNIWQADHIDTPFVMGVLCPRIYLPSLLAESEQEYVIAHERHHIKRGDPIWRALAFAALCLHWFNPLVWLAFALSRKDMELSCDEAVMREMGDIRAAYSESLLRFTTGKRVLVGAPLAFGESDTKERIVHVMKYKKPAIWVTVVAALLCVGAVTVFAFNAKNDDAPRELTAREALDALEASVRWEGENVYFTLPEDYKPASDWTIRIAGRAVADDGMSMSAHFFEDEAWEAGREYAIWLYDLTELIMDAALPDENGGTVERVINLLTGEREAVNTPVASTASWTADLDGDGRPEIVRLNASELETGPFTLPWVESADGTRLCELDPVAKPHAGWNTYALLEMDGRTYLFQYNPSMSTGAASYSYCIWSVSPDSGRLTLEHGKRIDFSTYAPMSDAEIDSLIEFINIVNGYWAYSRLLFTTDETVARGLVQPDGRAYPTNAPVICGVAGGPSYVEDLPWVTDALVEAGVFDGHLGLRERLDEYRRLAERRRSGEAPEASSAPDVPIAPAVPAASVARAPTLAAHGWGVENGRVILPDDAGYLAWLNRNIFRNADGVTPGSDMRTYHFGDPNDLLDLMENFPEYDPENVWEWYQRDMAVAADSEWLKDGKYRIVIDGKTYGPEIMEDIIGEAPDMILARGENGERGFVKKEEFNGPNLATREEIEAYVKSGAMYRSYYIPVYDMEGNVIDQFLIGSPSGFLDGLKDGTINSPEAAEEFAEGLGAP